MPTADGPQYTLGRLIADLESCERAHEANLRRAEQKEAESPVQAPWHYAMAGVCRFVPDPGTMPGVDRIQTICEAEWGKFTSCEVRRVRGRLCQAYRLTIGNADALTLEAAADLLESRDPPLLILARQFRKLRTDHEERPSSDEEARAAHESLGRKAGELVLRLPTEVLRHTQIILSEEPDPLTRWELILQRMGRREACDREEPGGMLADDLGAVDNLVWELLVQTRVESPHCPIESFLDLMAELERRDRTLEPSKLDLIAIRGVPQLQALSAEWCGGDLSVHTARKLLFEYALMCHRDENSAESVSPGEVAAVLWARKDCPPPRTPRTLSGEAIIKSVEVSNDLRHRGNAKDDLPLPSLDVGSKVVLPAMYGPAEGPLKLKPRWDKARRELSWGEEVCKRFRQPAKNQTLILDAFEEEGWPSRIDDPLPGDSEIDTRQRLANAVRALNANPCIQFELDGTSQGILWKPA